MPTVTLSRPESTVASLSANYFLDYFALRADKSALITTAASFPTNYFLENLVLRADNSARRENCALSIPTGATISSTLRIGVDMQPLGSTG